MLCLKKRRTYSFTQGVCADLPRRSKKDNQRYEGSLNMAITTLPRKNRSREERPSRMVLTVTEDTPADMLAGSMELLVQLPRDHHLQTQRVTVQRSTPMMDLLVQITTAHKLAASSYTLQAIGERGLVLPHQPNTPIGALDALQVKLLPKQGTFVSRKVKQANQPFETTFRLQVHLPRNQLYVSRVSPKMNLGDILEEVCREKNLDKNKYELRHPANLEETLDLSLSLQDYHLQEVTLYAKQGRTLGSALSTQDIMALQRQEDRRRQQAKQGVFGFVFKKSKEGSLSTDSLGGRSASPARSDETGRSASPLQPPARPQRKRRPAPKPPMSAQPGVAEENGSDSTKDKVVISHSRNSSDSSGYHEASVLSDNPDIAGRLPETLPRRGRAPMETARKLAQTAQSSKSLGNLATVSGTLARGISSTSLSSAGLRKKRAAPPPPVTRPLSSAISTQALERIVDSEESLTSDIDPSKPPSDIGAPSKANSDIDDPPKANSDIGVTTITTKTSSSIDLKTSVENNFEAKNDIQTHRSMNSQPFAAVTEPNTTVEDPHSMVDARVTRKRGKLVHNPSSMDENLPSYSFISKNSLENVLELGETELGYNMLKKRGSLFGTEKIKLQSKIEECRANRRSSNSSIIMDHFNNLNSTNVFRSQSVSSRNNSNETFNPIKSRPRLQKSRSFACSNATVKLKKHQQTWSLQGSKELGSSNDSFDDYHCGLDVTKSKSRLVKMQTLVNLDGIETDIENMPECGVLENRFSPKKLHADNYICDERCQAKALKHSLSFQCNSKLRETRIVNSFEKPSISRSFSSRKDFMNRSGSMEDTSVPRLGYISTTKCYNGSITSSQDNNSFNDLENNLSPPPLSTLQIFAISTKPLDIQVATVDSIPNDIDKLPSLPIIQHGDSKLESEKKLSILEPPPPGLVSRQESTESWNKFLVQLNSILESRVAGEPVPLPKPRKTTMANSVTAPPRVPKRRLAPQSPSSRNTEFKVESLLNPATKTFNKIPNDGEVLDVARNSPTNHLEPDQEVLKNSKDEELTGESTRHEIEMLKRLEETKDIESSTGPECLVLETKKVSGNLDNDLSMVQNKGDIDEEIIEEIKTPQVENLDGSLEVSLNEEMIPQLNTSQVSSDRNLDVSINEEMTEEEIKTPSVISPRSSKVSQEEKVTEELRILQTTSAKKGVTEENLKTPPVTSPRRSKVSQKEEITKELRTLQTTSAQKERTEENIKAPPVTSPRRSKVSQEEEITKELRTLQTTSAKKEITEENITTPPVTSPRRSKVSREEEIIKEVNIPQTTSVKNVEVSLNKEIIRDIKSPQIQPDQSMEVTRNEETPEEIKTPQVTPNQSILDSVSQEVTSEVKIHQTASTQNLQHTEKLSEKGEEKTFSEAGKLAEPRHSVKEKSYCAVISTLPKCEHLDTLSDKTPNKFEPGSNDKAKFPSKNSSKSNTPSPRRSMKSIKIDSLSHEIKSDACEESATSWTDDSPKESRRKVLRSASKSNDFEINSLKRQKRHLTSHAEDITFAMNLNLSPNVDLLSGLSKEHGETQPGDESNQEIDSGSVNEEILHPERGIQDAELSETDILLQKVSDTLSNSLPNSSNGSVPSQKNVQVKPDVKKTTLKKEERKDSTDGTINVISPNITVTSQQDTSDYVSAMDDDLSIPEWEYQLPAPPSAFRDSASPVFDSYDNVTVRSSDVIKESEASGENKNSGMSNVNHVHNTISSRTSEEVSAEMKKEEDGPKYLRHKQNSSLKKEVISELQNKIGTLPQPARESDRRIDNSSTPKVAPVDNTLSNFTITTYSRPKNVNIFEEVGQQTLDNADERFVRSFATLSRSKNNHEEPEEKFGREFKSGALLTMKKMSVGENLETIEDCRTVEPKMQSQQELHRWQTGNSGNEKITVQRSKSYISISDKGKYQSVIGESRNVGNDGNSTVERNENANVTGANSGTSRSNEKFSQWRENILKRQEEPTKEKQLQSLQVLKSILPQLKSAQQTEENVSKEYNGTVLPEKTRSETTSNEHSMESNATSARDSQTPSNFKQSDVESKKSETKRYIYSGPPAINLGSWSERPNANVQIKRDTDYKQSLNKVTNGRTIVNINGARDERDGYEAKSDTSSVRNYVKFEAKNEHTDRNSPDELTKKLISHTTAAGFKKPTLNKVNVEMKAGAEKPIVTGVELKKTFGGKTETKEDECVIDTTPVNFKELTKAFGQDVHLRSKPKRTVISRRSDPFNIHQGNQTDSSKQNGHINVDKVNYTDQPLANGNQINGRPKRFTSVVGIQPHNQGQSFGFRSGVKTTQTMPVVKGFKIQAQNGSVQNGSVKEFPKESSNSCPQPPKPPTMPVITGVTLKNTNARPKSMPVQLDARDTLLESIRNFGGRENLKNAAERR